MSDREVGCETETIALIGNPNTGKTTLFNALTGLSLHTGNYPGVTVEKKVGRLTGDLAVDILDLPGTYSLAARSPDEMVAVDVLLGRQEGAPAPDAVVVVVDASNLDRNLYLATQVMEMGLPVILALNMVDVAASRGINVDTAKLSVELGLPVISLVARSGEGLDELREAIGNACSAPAAAPSWTWPEAMSEAVTELASSASELRRCEIRRGLVDEEGEAERRLIAVMGEGALQRLVAARAAAGGAAALQATEAQVRYGYIGGVVAASVTRPELPPVTLSEKADGILTHKLWGSLLLTGVGYLVFTSIFEWAGPIMDVVDTSFAALGQVVSSWDFLGEGALKSLIVDGVIAGVGGVVIFLPQILILFAFLAILEDCGYMARAAFLMDRLLRWCGLSGRSFIPMLSSFACAVPGIMATRTIESRRDRLVTILVAPLMSCSARIPVYVILTSAFVPSKQVLGFFNLQALVFALLYFLGIVTSVLVAWVLRRTVFKGETRSFLMELPPYKFPSPTTVGRRMLRQGTSFLSRAGTLILASSMVIWALAYFPRVDAEVASVSALSAGGVAPSGGNAAQAQLQQSYLGRMGHLVEPIFAPIGWDWKISVAVIASFPAREVVVSTLGVIYGLGEDVDEESSDLRHRMQAVTWDSGPKKGQPVMDLAGALALMVFFALCAQCAATLMTIWKETGSVKWPLVSFTYMTVLAYTGALLTSWLVRTLVLT